MADPAGSESGGSIDAYPPYVTSDEQRRRWDVSLALARLLFADVGDSASVWMATRSIYRSDLPTDG